MARRTIRELSQPILKIIEMNGTSEETKRKWMRKGGKRRIRRMERHNAKKELKDGS